MANKKKDFSIGEMAGGFGILALLAFGFAAIIGICVKIILAIAGSV